MAKRRTRTRISSNRAHMLELCRKHGLTEEKPGDPLYEGSSSVTFARGDGLLGPDHEVSDATVKAIMDRARRARGKTIERPTASRLTCRERPVSLTGRAWHCLREHLAAALADMDEDDFLIISRKRGNIFVQFAAQGSSGIRMECTSNSLLPRRERLTVHAQKALVALGWRPPTYAPNAPRPEPPHGSVNFHLDVPVSVPCEDVAHLALITLRIFGVRHPCALQYKGFSTDGTQIRHAMLGLQREAKRRGR